MGISGEHMSKMVKSNQLNLTDGELDLLGFRMAMLPVLPGQNLSRIYMNVLEKKSLIYFMM